MAMGRLNRAILPMLLLGASLGLAACEPGEAIDKLTDLIPTNKTPLPGTRKEVFPQGVPGVPQGVPPELVKGYQPPPDVAAVPTPAVGTATPQIKSAAAEPPKPKKKKVVPPPATSQPTQDQAAAPAPASQTPAPWPAAQPTATAPWPAPQGQAAVAPWPSAPPTQRTQ